MVERQLARRGITDERVLAAMAEVPRERFIPEDERRAAYSDRAVAIGYGQTISQPWVVAAICQGLELTGGETVLDVGSGSGYSTAVLARLAHEVVGLEIVPELAESSATMLKSLAVENARIELRDGSLGAPELAPFGAIAVHAAAPEPPETLLEQLEAGGRMVVPVRRGYTDYLTRYRRREEGLEESVIGPCRFVPLVGEEGFND